MKIIETYSPEETFQAGKQLGEQAERGQVYCLNEISAWERQCLPRVLLKDWGFREM